MKKIACLLLIAMLVLLTTACNRSSAADEDMIFYIGTKKSTEQNILAEIAVQLIELKSPYQARISADAYETSQTLLKKIRDDDIQIYFDYASTVYLNGLERPRDTLNAATLTSDLKDLLWDHGNLSIVASVGYDGGMSLFMTPSRWEELDKPSTITNVNNVGKGLVLGMTESFFKRVDGYPALRNVYELSFKEEEVYGSEGDGFNALARGEIDIMIGGNTDIYNSLYDLYLLTDDLGFFLPCQTYCIINGTVRNEFPEVADALAFMDDLMTAGTMSSLVEKVEQEGQTVTDAVHDFLRARNLV